MVPHFIRTLDMAYVNHGGNGQHSLEKKRSKVILKLLCIAVAVRNGMAED